MKNRQRLIIYTLLILPFFQPQSYAIGAELFRVWQAAVIAVSLLGIVLVMLRRGMTKHWLCFVGLYLTMYIFATMSAGADGSLESAAMIVLKGVGFISLVDYLLWENPRIAVLAFVIAGVIMCGAHLVTWFQYKDITGAMRHGQMAVNRAYETLQNWYLLTYDNNSVSYFLPVLGCMWFYVLKYAKAYWIVAALFTVVSGIMYAYNEAITAEVVVLLFVAGLLVVLYAYKAPWIGKLLQRFTYNKACCLGIVFCVVVILGLLSGFFGDVGTAAGKGVGFSGRDVIWSRAVARIDEHPWLGYGYESVLLSYAHIAQTHCHNILLQVLYQGGLVSLFLLLFGIVFLAPSSKKGREDTDGVLFAEKMVPISILCFFVFATFDWMANYPVPFVLFLVAHYCTSGVSPVPKREWIRSFE